MQERNEELARKSAKASEEDIKTLTDEYEARFGASERKVYALTKERDMLRRGQEKLSSATDLVKEKDNIIAQVLDQACAASKAYLQALRCVRNHISRPLHTRLCALKVRESACAALLNF